MTGNRAVVVTGASTGIGRETALRLAASGWQVFAGVRKPEDGEALEKAAEASGARLEALRLDVTDSQQIEAARDRVSQAVAEAGLAGLVNNAGIACPGPLELLAPAELRRQLDINVVAQLEVTQAFLPMLRRAKGRIVNVSSVGGFNANPMLGAYAASKFALEALSDAMRRELALFGVGVSVVQPGTIETPIWDKAEADADALRATIATADSEVASVYGEAAELILQKVRERRGAATPALEVAKVIEHALSAAKPRTRYRVGKDARLTYAVSRLLPDRWVDAAVARITGFDRIGSRG